MLTESFFELNFIEFEKLFLQNINLTVVGIGHRLNNNVGNVGVCLYCVFTGRHDNTNESILTNKKTPIPSKEIYTVFTISIVRKTDFFSLSKEYSVNF